LYSIFFSSSTDGWAVGTNRRILKTTNGGTNWTTIDLGTIGDLGSVYFTSSMTGWLVGASGRILNTTNGGTNWISQLSGTSDVLFSTDFDSPTTGWIVGQNGIILYTTNGGTNWISQSSGTTDDLFSVNFISSTTGWAVGDHETILKTSNSGTNWIKQSGGNFFSNRLNSVYFISPLTGWAVGENGSILKTINGGGTTGIINNSISEASPSNFTLSQNYPNPFNPVTNLKFGISHLGFVSLKVYDVLGNEVATLVNEKKNAGTYNYQFSIVNYQLASGIYFYSLYVDGRLVDTKRLILLK